MSKNPKVIAGIIGAAVLAVLCAVVIARMVPTIGKVQVEMSLTPTPLPPVPASVRAVPGQPGQPTAVPSCRSGCRNWASTRARWTASSARAQRRPWSPSRRQTGWIRTEWRERKR